MKTVRFNLTDYSDDLTDILFENRNKDYGAYDLRKHYGEHLKKATVITASSCLLLMLFLTTYFQKRDAKILFTDSVPLPFTLVKKIEVICAVKPQVQRQRPLKKDVAPTAIIQDSLVKDKVDPDTIESPLPAGNAGPSDPVEPGQGNGTGFDSPKTDTLSFAGNKMDSLIMQPDTYPSFPGGQKALIKYLQNHLGGDRLRGKMHAKIYMSFVVTHTGSIDQVEIVKDEVGFGYGEEATAVLKNMPEWIPGKYNNHPVNVKLILPISFQTPE